MKKIFAIVLSAIVGMTVSPAQTGADGMALLKEIMDATSRVSSVRCDFVQTRQSSMLAEPAVSKGRMEYRRPGFLRWEYVSPVNVEVCVDGRSVTLKKDGRLQPAAGERDRFIKEMAGMIVGNIEGHSLMDGSMIKDVNRNGNGEILVVLQPRKSQLRKICEELSLTYNPEDYAVRSFEMKEMSGDITKINFYGAKYEFSE